MPCTHWIEGKHARTEEPCPWCEIERLRGGYKRLKESSDLEMLDGDLSRDIADEMLAPNSLTMDRK